MPDLPAVWGRNRELVVGAAVVLIVVASVGYGLARSQQLSAGAVRRDGRVERLVGSDPAAPVTAGERRAATERLRSICRDLEVRLAYNGPLEARPAPGPTPTGGLCAQPTLTDADVLRLRYAPTPPAGERFADEQQLAHWKRDTLCRRPEFRAATSASSTAGPPPIADSLHGICTKPTLGPDELRALRAIYVEDPVAAERARLQHERELANLTRTATTP